MSKTITPADYAKLEGIDTISWTPVYKSWETKLRKVMHDCDCGYCEREYEDELEEYQAPVGKPLHYKYHKPTAAEIGMYNMQQYYSRKMLDYAENNTYKFPPDNPGKSVTISFNRFSPIKDDE